MCYGYRAHLSQEERAELLKKYKKRLEERAKELEKEIKELEKQPAAQAA